MSAVHVSGAATRVAKEADLRVMVCDDRPAYANPATHPQADSYFCGSWKEAVAQVAPAAHHYLVVVTRGHRDDADVLMEIARQGCLPKYLGMIGSRAKKATLDRILLDEGVDLEFLAGVRTPIGLEVGAKSSGEIAVSLVAELVRLRRLGNLTEPAPRPLRAGKRHPDPV